MPPAWFGIDWRQAIPFYYLTLCCATLSYLAVVWIARTPFGLALQGVRDNPRRMSALGFSVTVHRILAYSFASVIAAFGGILLVWQNAQVVPGTAGIPQVIDILVIAVVGGLKRPIGPFIGALIYALLERVLVRYSARVRHVGRAIQACRRIGFSGRRRLLP